ncbi:MAG: proline dehydrogenase family protein [Planctomycetota bacterium]
MALFFKDKSKAKSKRSTDAARIDVTHATSSSANAASHGTHKAYFDAALEQRIVALGTEFLDTARGHKAGILSTQFWSDKLMDWSMQDEAFKVQLFRFVDTFPMLRTPEQVHEHLVDYLSQPGVTLPPGLGVGLKAGGLLKGAMSKTITGQITNMAEKFIAGVDAKSALPMLRKLWDRDIAFSVDLLGEACVSDAEAAMYQGKYLDLVRELPVASNDWPMKETLERDHLGVVPRTNVSIKITSLYAKTDAIDTEGSIRGLIESIRPILDAARERGVLVNFDMEHEALKDLTLELFMLCCDEIEFEAGLAMQAYLRSGDDDARRIIEWSKRTGRQVTIRLVKGAYWDAETIQAEMEGWPVPVWSRKQDTDACFERMTKMFIENTPRTTSEGGVKLALGSHNVRSIATALALLEKHDLPRSAIELQMLHGMADQLKHAAAEQGLRVREYVPVGEMIPGMAYLVRRLLENTSNESWLKAGFLDNASTDDLLASPHVVIPADDPGVRRIESAPERHALSSAVSGVGDNRAFFTEPMRDFSHESQRNAFAKAVAGSTVPSVANDSTVEQAHQAVRTAHTAFPEWRDTDPRERAAVLVRAADAMRKRRDELSGIIIRESGKTWREADADVCEAIDFCEYYARESIQLFEHRRLGQFIGELDQVIYQPRGVAVVISPWNFPLAICAGMTTAALVTGNTVVVKPSEFTSASTLEFMKLVEEAGFPPGVINVVTGFGADTGAPLVDHPDVSKIAFTGSDISGQKIYESAAKQIKHVSLELGGKSPNIVFEDADQEAAVMGAISGIFAATGQTCIAGSRLLLQRSIHDAFVERLVDVAKSATFGDPMSMETHVGPVTTPPQYQKVLDYIEVAKQDGATCVLGGKPYTGPGARGDQFVEPTIFTGVDNSMRIAQEEVFGPLLAVIPFETEEDAIAIGNDVDFGLAAGVWTQDIGRALRMSEKLRVGTVWVNTYRAVSFTSPFGGYKRSGLGRESGMEAINSYLQTKTIWIDTLGETANPFVIR